MLSKDVAFEKKEDGSGEVVVTIYPPNAPSYKITLAKCTAEEFDVASKWFFAGYDMKVG